MELNGEVYGVERLDTELNRYGVQRMDMEMKWMDLVVEMDGYGVEWMDVEWNGWIWSRKDGY